MHLACLGREPRPISVARILESRRRVRRVALGGVCLLVAVAPFEGLEPWLRLPGQNLSSVETVMLGVLVVWMTTLAAGRVAPVWRTPLTAPWLALIVASLVAAAAAPADRANAVHMVGRYGLALMVFVLAVNAARDVTGYRAIGAAFLATGAIVSALMIGEYLGVPSVLEALQPFRRGVAVVGSQVRAGGPFQYPTIASMFLEIAFAMGAGLLVDALDNGRRARAFAIGAVLVLIAEGVIVSFTRSGLITLALTLAALCGARALRRGFDVSARAIVAVGLVFAVQIASSRTAEAMRLRLTTEGQDTWYRAVIDAPADLSLQTGQSIRVPLRVKNEGRLAWDPIGAHPVRLSYHWIEEHTDRVVVWEGRRTEFADVVGPGTEVALAAALRAPGEPGRYRLVWDLEVVNRLWFSTEPDVTLAITSAAVTGPSMHIPSTSSGPAQMPRPPGRPGRLVLWRAAAVLLSAHAFLGIGPDNYRLHYGAAAGLAGADERVHSNNMYLEILVGSGLVGGLALLWLGVAVARRMIAAFRRTNGLSLGAAAAMAAVVVHGMADAFLGFTATYVSIAVVSALLVNADQWTERYADRV